MPQRIQRRRTKGWKMPPNTVYVGRPTKWGNPVRTFSNKERAKAVEGFREYLKLRQARGAYPDIGAIRGKDLACWCPLNQPCHADVLLEIANVDVREEKLNG